MRQQLVQRGGSADLAARLVPPQPGEEESLQRAQLLWDLLTSRAGRAVPMPQLQAGPLLGLPGGWAGGRRCRRAGGWGQGVGWGDG